jgi:rubredoxin oxidoreductase (desulfoferrodoxin)
MKKLYKSKSCGTIVGKVFDDGGVLACCGEDMEELVPKTADSATEKHVPVIECDGNLVKVTVGSTLHPMTEEHHIQFIILETNLGFQRKALKVDGEPVATFAIQDGEKVVAAYEYCNIHGFWVNELN